MKWNTTGDINPVERYFIYIQDLENNIANNDQLKQALIHKQWAVRAIFEAESEPRIRSSADHLIYVLNDDSNSSSEEVRSACRSFLASWLASRSIANANRRDTWTLATWATISGIASTWVGLLLGRIPPGTPTSTNNAILLNVDPFFFFIALINALFIILILLLRYSQFGNPSASNESHLKVAKDSFQQFLRGWTAIWVTWLLLYLWLATAFGLAHLEKLNYLQRSMTKDVVWALADIFNTANAVAFLYIFLVLDKPSVPTDEDAQRDRSFRIAFIIVIVIACTILIPSVLGRFRLFGLDDKASVLGALYTAIAMAYFFGRLDSHYLQVRRWMLGPLYLYVAIQLTWAEFTTPEKPSWYASVFLCLGLLLKVYLFVVVNDWLHKNKIQNYLNSIARDFIEKRFEIST